MTWTHPSVLALLKEYNCSDPVNLIKDLTRDIVLEAFNHGWSGPPYNPIHLASLRNLVVLPNQNVLDARTLPGHGDSMIIEYNPYQRETRINFSIAHEIGHTLFPDCAIRIRNREEKKEAGNWELEFLCDIAASEILLPYAEFTQVANSVPLSLESLLSIASRYQASIESVFLRFCDVVDQACTIILASYKDETQQELKVDYIKTSKRARLVMKELSIIPVKSCAYECLNSGWTAKKEEKWDEFENNPYVVSCIGLPPIKRQPNGRVGILITHTNFDDEADTRMHMVFGDATKPRGDGMKIIAQILNTSGGLGFGFGRAMSKVWPESKRAVTEWMKHRKEFSLGESKLTRLSGEVFVFQMIVQKGLFAKGSEILLKYDNLRSCLMELSVLAKQMNATVHMPKIGAGQAKGDWRIIEGIIYDELASNGIDVHVYVLPGEQLRKRAKTTKNLSLFDEDPTYEE